jgi:hypothetical protein
LVLMRTSLGAGDADADDWVELELYLQRGHISAREGAEQVRCVGAAVAAAARVSAGGRGSGGG